MEKEKYDLYYRDFPSNVVPVRTPFTRSGCHDAGHVFIYMTNTWKRWSLLLDGARAESVYHEARQHIPRGISQLWLLEKRYSTRRVRALSSSVQARKNITTALNNLPTKPGHHLSSGRPLIVLREPVQDDDARQDDVISYHFQETAAITTAETYTRRYHRRAIVGVLIWDEMWL